MKAREISTGYFCAEENNNSMADKDSIRVLTINRGSSSLKFAVYDIGESETLLLAGGIDKIGSPAVFFHITDANGRSLCNERLDPAERDSVIRKFLQWLKDYVASRDLDAVGYRVVHGGAVFSQPHFVTPELIASLKDIAPLDPDHLPCEIELIEAVTEACPELKQVACFDTAFHRSMPGVAQALALPGYLKSEGITRYGFHGLSYEYIIHKLKNEAGAEAADGKIIIAHLGSGASMAAVRHGKSIDTTMGFTPAGGLMMSTRSGDLDPGIILYLLEQQGLSPSNVREMLNKQSGLLGVSGLSSDMEELLKKEAENPPAAEAVELFCYQAKKFLGAFASVLDGLETLVFTAGIGENSPVVRRRICEDMNYLGISLDHGRNDVNAPVISCENSPVTVRVMKTNEQLMIARGTKDIIQFTKGAQCHERSRN